ncbi:hypothetical protein LOCC1_G005340 [Lachnellula occidentalis]|uniref:DUF302 domain-containing protein n=1 Tax=Lachnellula occidentalis TaxID=215460 RepID=A0A8H8RTM3_9HELO|nr:hypothetical protein LOCC1_G005340 [Lachnellula occidentalis]
MTSQIQTEIFTGTRLTLTTPSSFNTTLSNLYSEIGTPETRAWPSIAASITPSSETSKEEFIAQVEKTVGSKGFMIFMEIDHSAWLPLYGVGSGLQLKRIMLGNPLIAITMLEHDLRAGLAVSVELLVRELENGRGTDVSWQVPSTLVCGGNGDVKLVEAARVLDRKLEELVRWACE